MTFSLATVTKLALAACLLGFCSADSHTIFCRLWEVDVRSEQSESQSFDCMDDGKAYELDVPEGFAIKSGSYVSFSGTKDDANAMIHVAPESTISTHVNHRRGLVQTTGDIHFLVVRVNYRGATPSLSAAQLAGRVFGLGSQTVGTDMAEQFSSCSFGKFQVKAFKGAGVKNGVADIKITRNVAGSNVKVLQNLAIEEAKKLWKIGTIRHIAFVMPPGLKYNGGSYLAYAYLGSSISVYNDHFGGQLSALMHEVGHNLNLHHSGQGNDEYGDQSGYLGYGVSTIGGPKMCFNPQKFNTLGWLEDRSLSLDVEDLPWSGNIAGFVHYKLTAENQFVNLSLGGRSRQTPIYVHYNLARSFNEGTQEFRNRIIAVSAEEQFGALKSRHVGSMVPNANGVMTYKNFEGTGSDLVLKVCKKVKQGSLILVRISAHLDDGDQSDACKGALIEPNVCENTKNSVKFFVDAKRGLRNCQWLANRAKQSKTWTNRLCKSTHLAYHYCRETCGNC